MTQKKLSPVLFETEEARRAATARIMDKIHQVLFFYYQELERKNEIDDVNEDLVTIEDLGIFVWAIAAASMAAAGMRVIGVDEVTGRYVATFEPVESVRSFLIEKDIGSEDDEYFEDYSDDVEPDCGFDRHDEALMSD